MSFKVNGVDLFTNNGSLSKGSFTASRDGAFTDITGTDELLLFDGDGGDDVMKVTVDELFDSANSFASTSSILKYSDPDTGTLGNVRELRNFSNAITLNNNQNQIVNFVNLFNISVIKLHVKWANSDGSYGYDRVEASYDGATINVIDSTGNPVILNDIRAERLFTTTNGSNVNVVAYQQTGSSIEVILANNNGPLMRTSINVTYELDLFPAFPSNP